jgi:DNA repair protein RadC
MKRALQLNTAAVILSHNHLGYVTEPSQADELAETRLTEALALVDIRVLDHPMVGWNVAMSFAERELL